MLANIKIGTRLTLGFAVILLFMIVITAVSLYNFSEIHKKVENLTKDKWPKSVELNRITNRIDVVARAIRNAIILRDPAEAQKELDRVNKEREAIRTSLEALGKTLVTGEGKAKYQRVLETRGRYVLALDLAIALVKEGKKEEAGDLLFTRLRPAQQAYFEAVADLTALQGRRVVETDAAIKKMYDAAKVELILALVASVIASAGIGFVLSRSITLPLNHINKVNNDIASGDLSSAVKVDRRDELGSLQESASTMMVNLRTLLGRLSETSLQVAASSSQLYSTSERIAAASGQVAGQAGTIATAGEEMASTSGEISRSCSHVAEGSQQASKVANDGAAVVQRTVEVMERIAEKVQPPHARSRNWARAATRSARSSAPSRTSRTRPTCWRSTRPSRRRGPASRGGVSRWWPTRCAHWRSGPRRRPRRSAP